MKNIVFISLFFIWGVLHTQTENHLKVGRFLNIKFHIVVGLKLVKQPLVSMKKNK